MEEEPRGGQKRKKKNVSKEDPSQISNSKKITDGSYFVFVDDAHLCHVDGEVMLVGHDDLDFLHLRRPNICSFT